MRKMGIGEVCRLLDIRPHVLRYWEQEVPFFDPAKTAGGRRVYGDYELNLLYRIKYLIQERRFTLEGAVKALVDESDGPAADAKAKIQGIRKFLFDIRESSEKIAARRDSAESVYPGDQPHLGHIRSALPPDRRLQLQDDLLALPPRLLQLVRTLPRRSSLGLKTPRLVPRSARLRNEQPSPRTEAALSRGRIAVATLLPPDVDPARCLKPLERSAESLRDASYDFGRSLSWYIFAGYEVTTALRAGVRTRNYFGYSPDKMVFVREPRFPYLDGAGRLMVSPAGRILTYPSGNGGALLMLKSSALRSHMRERGVETLVFLPLNSYAAPFPDFGHLNLHFENDAELTPTCFRQGEGYFTTGVYAAELSYLQAAGTVVEFAETPEKATVLNPDSLQADDVIEADTLRLVSGPFMLLRGTECVLAEGLA